MHRGAAFSAMSYLSSEWDYKLFYVQTKLSYFFLIIFNHVHNSHFYSSFNLFLAAKMEVPYFFLIVFPLEL